MNTSTPILPCLGYRWPTLPHPRQPRDNNKKGEPRDLFPPPALHLELTLPKLLRTVRVPGPLRGPSLLLPVTKLRCRKHVLCITTQGLDDRCSRLLELNNRV